MMLFLMFIHWTLIGKITNKIYKIEARNRLAKICNRLPPESPQMIFTPKLHDVFIRVFLKTCSHKALPLHVTELKSVSNPCSKGRSGFHLTWWLLRAQHDQEYKRRTQATSYQLNLNDDLLHVQEKCFQKMEQWSRGCGMFWSTLPRRLSQICFNPVTGIALGNKNNARERSSSNARWSSGSSASLGSAGSTVSLGAGELASLPPIM